MRKRIFLALAVCLLPTIQLRAQPKIVPPPPEFERLIGTAKFDPVKLRAEIAYPSSTMRGGFSLMDSEKENELLPVAAIEKKLVGDERDAEWLLKLGHALTNTKSPRAKETYEKSVAAFRKRIEKEPHVGKRYLDLAKSLFALKRYDEAAANTRRCVELDPKCADGWLALSDCYWHDFKTLVYGDGENVFWSAYSNKPPPEIVRPLTDAEKDRARLLLKYVHECQQHWKKYAPDKLETLNCGVLNEAHWKVFDDFFRVGAWNIENTSFFEALVSKKWREKAIEYGREKQEPAAFAIAACSLMAAFVTEAKISNWTPALMKPDQKKALAELMEPIEKLADHPEREWAKRARLIRAMMAKMEGDAAKMERFAESALSMAPCDDVAINLLSRAQKDLERTDFEAYWLQHVRKHPSTHAWTLLALNQFRSKKFADAERSLHEAEKLDAKDRRVQLATAALALKRGDAGLMEAGKILDALEKRLDEPEELGGTIQLTELPTIPEAHRYLRAIHKSLAGDWEKGRDELMELRDQKVLADEIGKALEAFPLRPTILPVQRIGPAPRGKN